MSGYYLKFCRKPQVGVFFNSATLSDSIRTSFPPLRRGGAARSDLFVGPTGVIYTRGEQILGAPIPAKSLAEGIDDLQTFKLEVTNIARHNRHAV